MRAAAPRDPGDVVRVRAPGGFGLMCLGFAACQESIDELHRYLPRNVVVERWDTVFVAGGEGVNDTLIFSSHLVTLADSVVIVADGIAERVVALDAATGRLEWTFGRPGQGPGEFRGISDVAVTRDQMVWVLDFGNGRIAELSPDGQFHGVRPLHHLPAPPASLLPLDVHAIAMSHGAPMPFMEIGLDSLELRRAFGLSWPGPSSEIANTRVLLAKGPDSTWVSAFTLGPGFTIWKGSGSRSFSYREPIFFANRSSPTIRQMGADSARWAAVSLDVVGEDIFMLFGGRPARRAHPAEPTLWIDVYRLSGEYLHSYRLPFDTSGMATDGRTFYVLPSEGIPRLVALRPKED